MEYKEKVSYLKSYTIKKNRLIFLENQTLGVQAIKYSDDSSTGIQRDILAMIDEKIKIENELTKIELAIASIQEVIYRYVLQYKFIHNMSLETVSDLTGYSLSQTKRIYKKAINMIPNELF